MINLVTIWDLIKSFYHLKMKLKEIRLELMGIKILLL